MAEWLLRRTERKQKKIDVLPSSNVPETNRANKFHGECCQVEALSLDNRNVSAANKSASGRTDRPFQLPALAGSAAMVRATFPTETRKAAPCPRGHFEASTWGEPTK